MDCQSRSESNHRSDEILIPTGQVLHEVTQESSVGDEISNPSNEIDSTVANFTTLSCGCAGYFLGLALDIYP